LLVRNGNVQSIKATGVPVGLFKDAEYGVNKFTLDKDDTLLLYTDGLTEANVSEYTEGGEYGEQRLVEQLAGANGTAPKVFVDELIQNHKNWLKNSKPVDDVTVLVVKRMM